MTEFVTTEAKCLSIKAKITTLCYLCHWYSMLILIVLNTDKCRWHKCLWNTVHSSVQWIWLSAHILQAYSGWKVRRPVISLCRILKRLPKRRSQYFDEFDDQLTWNKDQRRHRETELKLDLWIFYKHESTSWVWKKSQYDFTLKEPCSCR